LVRTAGEVVSGAPDARANPHQRNAAAADNGDEQ
jgi:hypothetical protein